MSLNQNKRRTSISLYLQMMQEMEKLGEFRPKQISLKLNVGTIVCTRLIKGLLDEGYISRQVPPGSKRPYYNWLGSPVRRKPIDKQIVKQKISDNFIPTTSSVFHSLTGK